MPCKFTAPNKNPCPAFEDARSSRGYCFAHEEIYLHDCAVAYRKRKAKDARAADEWADRMGLPVERLGVIADSLKKHERPIALEIQ